MNENEELIKQILAKPLKERTSKEKDFLLEDSKRQMKENAKRQKQEEKREKEFQKLQDALTVRTCFADVDGFLLQQVKGNKFARYDGKRIDYVTEYQANDGRLFQPLSGEELDDDKNFIALAETAQEPSEPHQLIQDIIEFSRKYVDIPDDFRLLAAYFVLFTCLFDKFTTTPYLRFLGDTGCGKSRALEVFGLLCYNYISASGAATVAPIYRVISKWRGTIGFEEADFKQSDASNELIKVINCGFERGKPVLRCDENDSNIIRFFDAFCSKLFAMRTSFDDKATESRCISTTMSETARTDIPPILLEDFYAETQKLRNRLLSYRLKNWRSITPINPDDLPDVEPRLKQLATPIAPLFTNPEDRKKFFDWLVEYQTKLRAEKLASPAGLYLQALFDLAENDEAKPISYSELAIDLKVSRQAIQKELRSLGFETELRTVYIPQDDGTKKQKSIRAIVCNLDKWKRVTKRYFGSEKPLPKPLTQEKIKNVSEGGVLYSVSNVSDVIKTETEPSPSPDSEILPTLPTQITLQGVD